MLRFKENGKEIEIKSSQLRNAFIRGKNRVSMQFFIENVPYNEIAYLFHDDVQYEEISMGVLEEGRPPEEIVTDLSEYCVAGDITDHRNGTISVVMGKQTTDEIELEEKQKKLNEYENTDVQMNEAYMEGVQSA